MISPALGYPADFFGAFEVLKSRRKLAIDDLKMLAMLESAGEVFYFSMANGVNNSQAKALLIKNGNEERGHAHRLLKAIRLLGGEEYALPVHDENPFVASVMGEFPVNVDFLGVLEQGEKDGDLLYQGWAAEESNPEIAKVYRLNGREECMHGERAAQVKQLIACN